ncbi:MAG: M23 family metallopeptidase [Spirochaetaceae bacterium]|jgi:murein DD-endopeptidase MepM/ murein hydrolase activator NlpD|nr:M23 family metallopeptidase [Spirochaetaceae bacterium]
MIDIIQRQHIYQRKRSAFFPWYATYKPVDLVNQHPVRIRRLRKKNKTQDYRFFIPQSIPVSYTWGNKKSLLMVFLVTGFVLFAFLFFRRFNFDLSLPRPLEGGGVQRHLISYAGLIPQAVPDSEDKIPLDLLESFAWKSYTIKQGDSISKIAGAHSISMDAIIASNGITNARRLPAGEVIRIPNMDGIPYTVKKGDTLSKISGAHGVPLEAILDANDIQNDFISSGTVIFIPGAKMRAEELKLALGELFIYPIRGRLTSPYGWRNDPISGVRRYHAALDLAAPTGTPVKASMDGRIITLGFNSVYGKYIIMSHASGFQTLYAHLNATSVGQGAYVPQGTKIGEVGSTGYSTGPHLHFGIFKNGKAVNPLEFLNS